ncbi:MAG: FecR domain-containing protein [Bacteroidales bacterium]|nr:FecR domain-containing protein [Bacteroidales bacterium]
MNEKAIYLINRLVAGEISEAESKELNLLIENGVITSEEIEDFNRIWNTTKHFPVPDFNTEKSYEKLFQPKLYPHRKRNRIFINILRVAAIIVFGVFIGIGISRIFSVKQERFVEIETKKGDKIHITLPEGSEVWLNSKSKIKYPVHFTGTNRYIELLGEAYFRLDSSDYKPVIIKCNGTRIVGSMASFNARTDSSAKNIQITVETGYITLTDPMWDNEQIVLEAGFKGTVDEKLPLLIEQNRNPNYLAWKTGRLVFEKVPLVYVAETISDVYDVNIQVQGEVKYCSYSNAYNNNDIDKILNDLKNQFNTSISRDNNMIIIRGNSCNI